MCITRHAEMFRLLITIDLAPAAASELIGPPQFPVRK